ncbi:uncharacterized protein LOC110906539 [Helianthus annuus]|uniref:uncharacterized protein LOC110906539 n=1 Tax=Helianthus annuus TaxID=4232 RepID=UPI000B8F21AE|nr:uncharacterized protein LOC110906539 [Helianthus annuus]
MVHFLAIQETKLGVSVNFTFNGFWGRSAYSVEVVEAQGRSGGLACLWNPAMFSCDGVIKDRYFLMLSGTLVHSGDRINLVNVYASNDASIRRNIWSNLIGIKNAIQGLWVFMGDFNEVRDASERLNSEFSSANAEAFNHFILFAGLSEYQMGGGRFTYISDNGVELSKLEWFLVCLGFLEKWPMASDHRPILLSTLPSDFGHIPFRCFNSWLEIPGFLDMVKKCCLSFVFNGPADMALAVKLRGLKNNIKAWLKREKEQSDGVYEAKKNHVRFLENLAEERELLVSELNERSECINSVMEVDRRKQLDAR